MGVRLDPLERALPRRGGPFAVQVEPFLPEESLRPVLFAEAGMDASAIALWWFARTMAARGVLR